MLTAAGYLVHAKSALHYTRSKLDWGETNSFGKNLIDLVRGRIFSTLPAMQEVYSQEESYMKAMKVPAPSDPNWPLYGLQYIEAMATSAITMHVGNCEEMAAVAFWYLHNQGVRPLDYMMIAGKHAFVVLGAAARPTTRNFNEWSGGSAMLCDPWSWRAQPADNLCYIYPHDLAHMGSAFRED